MLTLRTTLGLVVLLAGAGAADAADAPAAGSLRGTDAFQSIQDPQQRSVALFEEAGKVIQHPRCVNCHPVSRRPIQGAGAEAHPHMPPVNGGPDGHGVPGLPCASCHTKGNVTINVGDLRTVPGNPKWGLAPAEMAWEGKSLGQICQQIKDPARNGGKDMAALHHHMAADELVAWGWKPGEGRQPAPGTQKAFGELIKAWIDSGAHCPA